MANTPSRGWRVCTILTLALSLSATLPACATSKSASPTDQAAVASDEVTVTGSAHLQNKDEKNIELRLDKPSGRATIEFDYPATGLDLSAFRDLSLKVHNQSSAELDVVLTGVSNLEVAYKSSAQGRFLVRPAEQADLRVLMMRPALPKTHPIVQRLGNLFAFPWGHQQSWQYMDTSAVVRVTARIDWVGARSGQSVHVSRPFGLGKYSVDPSVLDSLDLPLVDNLGQERGRDWPGKVAGPEALREDAARDLELVSRVTQPGPGRDRFGGYNDAPALKATGFFRVEKVRGKWWFVDPDGRLFWSVGVNCAGQAADTRVKGREALFPEASRTADEIFYYWNNLELKHGAADWQGKHVNLTLARMMDWGINTIGAWSKPELMQARRVPYTIILHAGWQGVGGIKKIADPFSDDFKNDLETNLSKQAALHADSPWLIGVFIDNELEWGGGTSLAREALKSHPRSPARIAMVKFLQKRYGEDIAAINQAWGTDHSSWNALRARTDSDAPPACERDLRDFTAFFADTYFAACREAMRRHFPNHLYLGCRFHTINPIITASAARHCDVISANLYRYNVSDFKIPGGEDRPCLISEFHFGVRDYGAWGFGLVGAADARNQSDLLQAYLSDALRNPSIVGAHWFMWSDQIITGRADGENFGVGLVTVVDRPVTTLIEAFSTVSRALYPYRLSSPEVRIGAPVPAQTPSEKKSAK